MTSQSDITYKSNEELYMSWYLNDLSANNIINRYMYESNTFTLSKAKSYPILRLLKTKTKIDELSLLQEHVYTPDFLIEWNEDYKNIFFRIIDDDTCTSKPPWFAIRSKQNNKPYTFFEVKPIFDQNNMTRCFRITQKWLYDKYGLYVELVTIPDLFKKTFVPSRYRLTDKSRQIRKINFNIRSIEEYIKTLK